MRKLLEIAAFASVLQLGCGCGLVGFDSAAITAADGGDGSALDGTLDSSVDGGIEDAETIDPPPPTELAHVCWYTNATVILDGDPVDGRVGGELAAAIQAGCGTTINVRMLSEDTPGLLDPTTRAPLLGAGDLGLVGGDSYYQDVMGYLQMSLTPLRSSDNGTTYSVERRSTGASLLNVSLSSITPTHDYAVIQIIHDPGTNSTVIATHGYYFGGTLAGSFYFATNIAPALSTETRGYFLVEWTNADGNAEPSAGDTYTLLATGP